MLTCKNCGHPLNGKYCPQCGQSALTERFTGKQLLHEFIHGFYHVDHGLIYTTKALFLNPGKMLRDYLHGKRKVHLNPFTFILIVSGLLTIFLPKLIAQSLFVEYGLIESKDIDKSLMQSSFKHISIRIILGLPLFALVSYIFYRKKEFNFSENLIANTYLRGLSELFMIVLFPLLIISPSQATIILFSAIYFIITLFYYAWAYSGLFENRISFRGIIKGFTCALIANIIEITLANLLLLI
jgi:hypothetical protein